MFPYLSLSGRRAIRGQRVAPVSRAYRVQTIGITTCLHGGVSSRQQPRRYPLANRFFPCRHAGVIGACAFTTGTAEKHCYSIHSAPRVASHHPSRSKPTLSVMRANSDISNTSSLILQPSNYWNANSTLTPSSFVAKNKGGVRTRLDSERSRASVVHRPCFSQFLLVMKANIKLAF